ncbi:MAG: S41 family peptidase [Haliscomenobacter sp.]|nr:S41 family peptidase [Haliscomenobacter sp.]
MPRHKSGRENLQLVFPLIAALFLIIGFILGSFFAPQGRVKTLYPENSSAISTLNEALGFLSSKYVDPLDKDSLAEEAISFWMSNLDPFSTYIKSNDLAWMNERLSGSYVGIGIEFMIKNDSILVVSVLENGPAETAGMQVGDILLAAGSAILDKASQSNPENIIKNVRGKEGSSVGIKIYRPSTGKYVSLKCIRKGLDMPSVGPYLNYNKNIGYIKIKEFSATTDQEFMLAMDSLFGKQGSKKDLILDLRGNPGGYLEKATHMLNQLIPESGKVMVSTKSKSGKETVFKSSGRPFFPAANIVVLIDENAASASEIVAGALQDIKRATIVGRRSFGKGLVQAQYKLSNGGALKLTIAKFYTPSGKLIQNPYQKGDTSSLKRGISPDVLIPLASFDTSGLWENAKRLTIPFVIKNKPNGFLTYSPVKGKVATINWAAFLPDNKLVSAYLKEFNLGDEIRLSAWKRLKVAYAKQYLGNEAAMSIEFEVDPFLKEAIRNLENK